MADFADKQQSGTEADTVESGLSEQVVTPGVTTAAATPIARLREIVELLRSGEDLSVKVRGEIALAIDAVARVLSGGLP